MITFGVAVVPTALAVVTTALAVVTTEDTEEEESTEKMRLDCLCVLSAFLGVLCGNPLRLKAA
jgi:hypothetical protein